MIIEYLGMPGSGKTFRLNQYKQKIVDKGVPFLDVSRYSGMSILAKLFYKIADLLILVIPKYRLKMKHYKEGCTTIPFDSNKEAAFLNTSFDCCIKDIVLAIFIHDVFKKSNWIVLNDEGLLHRITMVIVLYGVDLNRIMEVYHREKHHVETIFVDTSVENAFLNIRNRNRHVCGFDEMDDEMLYGYLNLYDKVSRKVFELAKDM